MKKISCAFAVFAVLLASQAVLASRFGHMIQIENDSAKTYFPKVLFVGHCISNQGNWPDSVPAHTTSAYIYVENQLDTTRCTYGTGNLRVGFTSDDQENYLETEFRLKKREIKVLSSFVSNAGYTFVDYGLSNYVDYAKLTIK